MSRTPRAPAPDHEAAVTSPSLETRPHPCFHRMLEQASPLPVLWWPLILWQMHLLSLSVLRTPTNQPKNCYPRALFPRKKRAKHPHTPALCQESTLGLQGSICCPFGKMKVRPSEEPVEESQVIPRQVSGRPNADGLTPPQATPSLTFALGSFLSFSVKQDE